MKKYKFINTESDDPSPPVKIETAVNLSTFSPVSMSAIFNVKQVFHAEFVAVFAVHFHI
jgi:hypothetical protein